MKEVKGSGKTKKYKITKKGRKKSNWLQISSAGFFTK